jgi:hypothetical protein
LRDNGYFKKFISNYNHQLINAFEEADRVNKSGNSKLNTSTATLKQEVLAYMEEHSEIRKLMREEVARTHNNSPRQHQPKVIKV